MSKQWRYGPVSPLPFPSKSLGYGNTDNTRLTRTTCETRTRWPTNFGVTCVMGLRPDLYELYSPILEFWWDGPMSPPSSYTFLQDRVRPYFSDQLNTNHDEACLQTVRVLCKCLLVSQSQGKETVSKTVFRRLQNILAKTWAEERLGYNIIETRN